MKILLSAKSVTDRNANYQSSADTRRKNLENRLRNIFLEGLKQSYFKDQSVEYLNIYRPPYANHKSFYEFEFELSNTRSEYDKAHVFGDSSLTPSKIAAQLNKLHDDGSLLLLEEAKERDAAIRNKMSNLGEMIDPILVKYDITGRVIPNIDNPKLGHEQVIILKWDIDDVLGCEYYESTLTYRQHHVIFTGFYFNGHSADWYVEKSDQENLRFIENAIAQTVSAVKNWMETVDYVVDNLHDIEYQVNSELSRFEYDGVTIDDIDVKTNLDDPTSSYKSGPRIDDSIIISFHMYGYGGKIDLDVKYTWGEWNSIDINKKLINIIKYRKRKYDLA